jgi:hypothetical protein
MGVDTALNQRPEAYQQRHRTEAEDDPLGDCPRLMKGDAERLTC